MSLLLCLCFLLISPTLGESDSQMVDQLRKEMKTQIEEMRIQREEEKEEKEEMKTQIEEMRTQRAVEKEEKEEMRAQIEEIRIEIKEEKQEKSHLITKLDAMSRKVDEQEEELSAVKTNLSNTPMVLSCVYRYSWTEPGSVITYESYVVEFETGGGHGGMDLDTGRFTVGPGGSGYYTVTYSGQADLDGGEYVVIYLLRNGETVGDHGMWYSRNYNTDIVYEQGARTTIIHLEEGDYLELRAAHVSNFSGEIYQLTFCASLLPLPN